MMNQSIEKISTESRKAPEQAKQDFKNQEWFTSLDGSSQQKVIELFAKIEDLKKKLDGLNAEGAYKGTAAKSLFARINNNSKMKGDPEAQPTLDLYEFYRKGAETALSKKVNTETEVTKLEAMIKAMSDGLGDMQSTSQEMRPEAGQKKYEGIETAQKDISKMSNADILKLAPAERLPYITKGSVDAGKVISGETKTVEFTFSSEGKLNRDLYMYTTAGQALPSEVRRVSSGGQQYERIGTSGEFYNTTNQKRLVIHEGTELTVEKVGSKEELELLSKGIEDSYQKFLQENPKYNTKEYQETIKEVFIKGLGEKEVKIIVENNYSDIQKLDIHEAEKLLTVTRYLKNGGFLDGFDHAENLVENIEDIIRILKEHGKNLKYNINSSGKVEFEMNNNGLPVGIEGIEGADRVKQIALSQVGVTEHDGGANKYFSFNAQYSQLDARNVPWCAAFVNWTLAKAGVSGTESLAAKSFINSEGFGHVGFKVGNKILGGNQGNRVSLMPINKPIVGFAVPVDGKLEVHRGVTDPKNIPDGAIIVYDRTSSNKQFS